MTDNDGSFGEGGRVQARSHFRATYYFAHDCCTQSPSQNQ